MALHYNLRYPTLVTKSRVTYAIGTIWLIMFLWLGFYLWNKLLYHLMAGIFTGLCLIISTFSYIRIFCIVRQHQLQIHVQQQAVENSNVDNYTRMLRLRKSAMNTFVSVLHLYDHLLFSKCCSSDFVWNIIQVLGNRVDNCYYSSMNSAINPILYCWRLRDLRTAALKLAKQMFFKQTNENS